MFPTECSGPSPLFATCAPSECVIHFERRSSHAGARRFDRSHKDYDGVGGMLDVLREVHETAPACPTLAAKHARFPETLAALTPPRPVALLPRGRGPKEQDLAVVTLSAEDTDRLRAAARRDSVTVGTVLLHALGLAAAGFLDRPGEIRWLVPVNMRGPVTVTPETGNCFSLLALRTGPGSSPAALAAELASQLEAGVHWMVWMLIQRASQDVLAAQMDAQLGPIFSNIGRWDVAASDAPDEVWSFCPPTWNPKVPLAVGVVTVNGRCTVTFRAHPLLDVDLSDLTHRFASNVQSLL